MIVKKVSVNVNLTKSGGSQGKLTPRRQNTVTTPRQEKPNHAYKKSFCQTDEENSVVLVSQQDIQGTPSEKNSRP